MGRLAFFFFGGGGRLRGAPDPARSGSPPEPTKGFRGRGGLVGAGDGDGGVAGREIARV